MKKLAIGLLCATSIMLLSGCQAPGTSAYYRGSRAFKRRNYTASFTNYLYAARLGITPAQYAVAYQYYYGLGTNANLLACMKWLKRAAPRSLRAQYALNQIKHHTEKQPWAAGFHWK